MVSELGNNGLAVTRNMTNIANSIRKYGKTYFKEAKNNKVKSPVMEKDDVKILENLAKDEGIIITRPDKGNGVVVLNKVEYMEKMNGIVGDTSKFRKVTGDVFYNIIKLEDKLNRILRTIKEKIGLANYSHLYASGTVPGVMYGLPKIHKQNRPLRPIISCINSTAYKVAKFLLPVIIPFTRNMYTIDNSKSFVDELRSLNITNEMTMASFDVESLFTNVPLVETTNMILEKYDPSKFFGIARDIVKKLLRFATSESIFLFNNCLYNQIDGISMGSSLGPVYANAFMCFKESEWLENCPAEFKPTYYRRYVDDTFLLFREKHHANMFLTYMNDQHPNIKFTYEMEKDGRLPFLDVLITKRNGNIVTSVYRKGTFTGLGLNWFSYCPEVYKLNSVKTLLSRAYDICSSYLVFHEEVEFLKKYFLQNNYKLDTFYDILRGFMSKKRSATSSTYDVPKMVKYVKLPFYGKPSYDFRKKINFILKEQFPAIDFRFIFTNSFTVGSFFKIKDRIPDSVCSNIIYQFDCPSCGARYLGSSARSYKCRILEHIGKSFRTGEFLNKMPFSSIRNHSHEKDHPFNENNFKILQHCTSHQEALIGEKKY